MHNSRNNMKSFLNIDYDCSLSKGKDNQEEIDYLDNTIFREVKLSKRKTECKSSLSYTSTLSHNIHHKKFNRYDTSNRLIDSVRSKMMKKIYSRHLYFGVRWSGILTVFIIFTIFLCHNPMCMAFRLNEESNSIYPEVTLMPSSSTSHKHHSKTIDVFYQAGVGFYEILLLVGYKVNLHWYVQKFICL